MNTESKDETIEAKGAADQLLVKSKELLRQARITGLGVADLAPQWGKELSTKIMDAGRALDPRQDKANAEKKHQRTKPQDTPKTKPGKEQSPVGKAVEKLSTANEQLRLFSIGLIDTVAQARSNFVNQAIERGNSVSETKATAVSETNVATETIQESKSALVRAVGKVRNFNRGAYRVVKEKVEQLYEQSQEQGKIVDLDLRRQLETRRQQFRTKRERLLARLGLVTHQEIEDLNKRLILLASELKHQVKEENKAILERRKQERRNLQAAIEYDLRVFSRRERDRRAA